MPWHTLSLSQVIKKLASHSSQGLSEKEARIRLQRFGSNQIPQEEKLATIKIILSQFKSPLIYILLLAGLVTLLLKEYTDAGVIFAAVLVNALLGFIQENKANQSLAKLRTFLKIKVVIVREGKKREISEEGLVPGDIVLLKAGDKVPADGRVIEAESLKVNESILTGEWLAVYKEDTIVKKDSSLGERSNMVYKGTSIEQGQGKFIVTSTGKDTEIGKIASSLKKIEEKTLLQKKIKRLSKFIGLSAVTVITFLFIEGLIKQRGFLEMFNIAVATAVAMIPEGLPISLTAILALGMQRLLKKKGLVKRLASAETLGSASIICTDKTGTLTQGRMEVAHILSERKKLLGKGKTNFENQGINFQSSSFALKVALLSTSAFLETSPNGLKKKILRGDPTERALLEASLKAGLNKDKLEQEEPKKGELLFNPENKFSATLRQLSTQEDILYLTGAPEVILKKSKYIYLDNTKQFLTKEQRRRIKFNYEYLSKKGLRVLGVAYKRTKAKDNLQEKVEKSSWIKDLCHHITFVGLFALQDPLRRRVISSIALCKKAGIRPIIVTGDHSLTAQTVAKNLGFEIKKENIIEGRELAKLNEKNFNQRLEELKIYARVNPSQKLRIVKAWQRREEVVAMTGDGVNDAPALKKADIGVALGSGTEIAKEAADLILLNNNFSVIVEAVKEGRRIIDNIRKVITYLLSDSFTEVILIAVSIFLGLPLPILPIQILWVNFIEDGFPDIALAFEKREEDIMERKPEKKITLFTREMKVLIFLIGLITDGLLLALFLWLLRYSGYEINHIRSIIFTGLTIDSLFYVFSCKSLRKNLWHINPFSNKVLNLAWFLGIVSLLLALYFPPLRHILKLVSLNLKDWYFVFGLAIVNLSLIEFTKWIFIKKLKN